MPADIDQNRYRVKASWKLTPQACKNSQNRISELHVEAFTMPGQWTERGLFLWGLLYFISKWLYYILWVIPVAILILPVTLPLSFRRPRHNSFYHDTMSLVWCAPILLYEWTRSVYQNVLCAGYRRQRYKKRFRRLEPAALPALRKRRLSQGHMRPQTQSSFLAKLPLEIRQMIYEEVIRDGALHRHIVELRNIEIGARNQLCGIGCKQSVWGSCTTVSNAPETQSRKTVSNRGPLALAKSCRQMYLETINMFYGELGLKSASQ